jgi:hypothetical protein
VKGQDPFFPMCLSSIPSISLHPVGPLGEHLLPLYDQVKLVLEVLFDETDSPVDFIFEVRKD